MDFASIVAAKGHVVGACDRTAVSSDTLAEDLVALNVDNAVVVEVEPIVLRVDVIGR